MKRIVYVLAILILMTCSVGCESGSKTHNQSGVDENEPPRIVFLVRSDLYDIVKKDIVGSFRLGFYDNDGNFYISTDSDLNDMDNKTLLEEYEAGHLTDQIEFVTNCDADKLLEQYESIRDNCLEDRIVVDSNEEIPANPTKSSTLYQYSTWYSYYVDQDGEIKDQTIHISGETIDFYSNNDIVNEVYDWIRETLQNIEI